MAHLKLVRQHYRLHTIHKIPTLKVLDFLQVKEKERNRAGRLALSAALAALEGDVKAEIRQTSNWKDVHTRGGSFNERIILSKFHS